MSGNETLVRRVRERAAREFPELASASAEVKPQSGGARYLVILRGHAELPGGRRLERIVRATVDDRGRILKWSTSR
jgi:hypothetical protein